MLSVSATGEPDFPGLTTTAVYLTLRQSLPETFAVSMGLWTNGAAESCLALPWFVKELKRRESSIDIAQEPTSIIMPRDHFPVENCAQQKIVDRFVRDLSTCFQINMRKVRLQDLWVDSPPFEANGQPLQVYLKDVGQNSFFYDFYHSSDSFRAEYEHKYHRAPAVNKVTKWRWEIAKGISRAQRDEAVRRLGVYKRWLLETVLVGDHPIVILPVMKAEPTYRDTRPSSPATQEAWDQLWMAPILGSPEVTLPSESG